jgi:hypothetical protein
MCIILLTYAGFIGSWTSRGRMQKCYRQHSFDHICKKSKDFSTLMVSKSMDSSYELRVLKKLEIWGKQFGVDHGCLHAGEATRINTEPIDSLLVPTKFFLSFVERLVHLNYRFRLTPWNFLSNTLQTCPKLLKDFTNLSNGTIPVLYR